MLFRSSYRYRKRVNSILRSCSAIRADDIDEKLDINNDYKCPIFDKNISRMSHMMLLEQRMTALGIFLLSLGLAFLACAVRMPVMAFEPLIL